VDVVDVIGGQHLDRLVWVRELTPWQLVHLADHPAFVTAAAPAHVGGDRVAT
jgi:hypothetical protein